MIHSLGQSPHHLPFTHPINQLLLRTPSLIQLSRHYISLHGMSKRTDRSSHLKLRENKKKETFFEKLLGDLNKILRKFW